MLPKPRSNDCENSCGPPKDRARTVYVNSQGHRPGRTTCEGSSRSLQIQCVSRQAVFFGADDDRGDSLPISTFQTVPHAYLWAGDVAPKKADGSYGDGSVGINDATRILRYAVGLEGDPWP